jgi:hypothetical protein
MKVIIVLRTAIITKRVPKEILVNPIKREFILIPTIEKIEQIELIIKRIIIAT